MYFPQCDFVPVGWSLCYVHDSFVLNVYILYFLGASVLMACNLYISDNDGSVLYCTNCYRYDVTLTYLVTMGTLFCV